MKIKIFGERNTGTNYIEKLVEENTEGIVLKGTVSKLLGFFLLKLDKIYFLHYITELIRDIYFLFNFSATGGGWKHREVDIEEIKEKDLQNDIIYICVVKNPYSWALSLFNNPYHQYDKTSNFSDFLSKKWKTVKRESNKKYYLNVIDMWNIKLNSYLKLKEEFQEKVIIIKYEDILLNHKILFDFLIKNRVVLKNNTINIEASTKEGNKNNSYYKDYYLNEKWKEKYSKEEILLVNKYIDIQLLKEFDYEKL